MDEAGWLALVAGEGGGGGGVALHQGDTRGEARLILSQGIKFTSSGGHQRRPKKGCPLPSISAHLHNVQ